MKYQVQLTRLEAEVIARNLGLSLPEFIDTYTDSRWPGSDTFLIKHESGSCVFLQYSETNIITGCRIHIFRPQACRDWAAGLNRAECRRGRVLLLTTVKTRIINLGSLT